MNISYILKHLQQMKYDIKLYVISIGNKATDALNRPCLLLLFVREEMLNFSEIWHNSGHIIFLSHFLDLHPALQVQDYSLG